MDFRTDVLDRLEMRRLVKTPEVTTDLPALTFDTPKTFEEMMNSKGSFAGNSAVAEFLTCPEKARLRACGLRKKGSQIAEGDEMRAKEFGVLMHCLLSIRVVHGMDAAVRFIGPLGPEQGEMWSYGIGLSMDDRLRSFALLKTYDKAYPLAEEPFDYLACEVEVVTDLSLDPGRRVVRSARYDKVVRDKVTGSIFSLEHKTAAQGGEHAMLKYQPQFMIQGAIWNRNAALVAKYGPMKGIIPDVLVKTKTPKVERHSPQLPFEFTEPIVAAYMTLPEDMKFPVAPDGSYPKMLHACWSNFGRCEYVDGCWDGAWGSYERSDDT